MCRKEPPRASGKRARSSASNGIRWKQFVYQLVYMHFDATFMHMRTTLNIQDQLLAQAARLTGVQEKTKLVRLGLEALIARESARRLASLGGTEPRLKRVPRRRPGAA